VKKKIALITGASSGIGKSAAIFLDGKKITKKLMLFRYLTIMNYPTI